MVKRVVPKALVACLIGMVSLAAQGCVAQSPSRTPVSPSSPRATPSSVTASPRTTTASPTPVPTRPRDVAVAAALRLPVTAEPSLDDIFEADRLARAYTRERFSDR